MKKSEAIAGNSEFPVFQATGWTEVMHALREMEEDSWVIVEIRTQSASVTTMRNAADHSALRHLRPYGWTFRMVVLSGPRDGEAVMMMQKTRFPARGKEDGIATQGEEEGGEGAPSG